MTDQTRANFEAHFQLTTRQAWQHKDGSYQFPEIQAKWEGYLAGVAKAGPVAAMTDDDIIKLAQQFNVRKTWAEVAEETVSYKFDAMGFARALLAKAAPLAAAAPAAGTVAPLPIGDLLAIYDNNDGDWCGIARAVEDHYIAKLEVAPVAAAAPRADRKVVAYMRPDGLVITAAEYAKHDTDDWRWILEKHWSDAKPLYD